MEKIKAGFIAFNGYVFTQTDADTYNRACSDVARAIALAGPKPSPMARDAIERARDNQNRTFKVIIGEI
ncbi:hypothetical protein [Marinobacter nauticus]|uniref:hypothetical protein n=1 Tax=Marinobacter nauticus TaxID=2743 RepID=UPI0037367B21